MPTTVIRIDQETKEKIESQKGDLTTSQFLKKLLGHGDIVLPDEAFNLLNGKLDKLLSREN